MKHVTLLAVPNCIAATVMGPFDVLRNAGLLWGPQGPEGKPVCRVEIAGIDNNPVVCGNRFTITPHRSVADMDQTDVVLVSSPGPGVIGFMERYPQVIDMIRDLHGRGIAMASVCAGSFLLAEAGILDGKVATTHWAERATFQHRYPKVDLRIERMITDDGGVICAGGVYAALDLALYLIEKHHGRDVAVRCSKSLIVEAGRASQARFSVFDFQKKHGDDTILVAQEWIEANVAGSFLLEELAGTHGMSARNFSRRFKKATGDTPLHYQQRLRIAAAGNLLENDHVTIEEVCYQVGYEDVDYFRNMFKRHMGVTPATYRLKFSQELFA